MILTVAITGATGFVGGHVLDRLLAQGHHVRALTRGAQPRQDAQLTWVPGSLQDQGSLDYLVENADVVIHIAGVIKAARRQDFFKGNVDGTQALLSAIEAAMGKAPAKYIHLSSLAAREPELSAYAASKALAEQIVLSSNTPAKVTLVRPPAVYGPGDRETLFYFKAATSAFAAVPGKSTYRTSLIHVQDLANALVHLAEQEQPEAPLVEVHDGTAKGYSVLDVLNMVAPGRRTGLNTLYLPLPLLMLVASVGTLVSLLLGKPPMLTTGKSRELCHPDWVCQGQSLADVTTWRPTISAAEGMQETLHWYREHGFLG